jgi:NAD(P)-dependent dehydrogenase (short-subunit alcohol dehydrogenase family)
MPTYLITGATSGLGLQVALRLARQGGHHLILPVRDAARGDALRRQLDVVGRVLVATPALDLASLPSVAGFLQASAEMPVLSGVLLNAGMQSGTRLGFTADGIEATFAVNHLAHYLLLEGLLGRLAPGSTVVWTASGTHDPKETAARMSGYRGARYSSVAQLAAGDYGTQTSGSQACRDAYATSKLCNIVSARIFAGRHPQAASFHSFDPGLMPGTGLARDMPPVAQWVWHHVMPRLSALMPGTSTPARSAELLTDLLTGRLRGTYNGAYFRYLGRQVEPASPATESWVAEDLAAGSERLLQTCRTVTA